VQGIALSLAHQFQTLLGIFYLSFPEVMTHCLQVFEKFKTINNSKIPVRQADSSAVVCFVFVGARVEGDWEKLGNNELGT